MSHKESVRAGIADAMAEVLRNEHPSDFVRNIVSSRMRVITGLSMVEDTVEKTFHDAKLSSMSVYKPYAWNGYVRTSDGVVVYTIDNRKKATATRCRYIGGIYTNADKPTELIRNVSEGFVFQDLVSIGNFKCSSFVHDIVAWNTGSSRPDGNSCKGFTRNNDKYFIIVDGSHDQFFQEWRATQSEKSRVNIRYKRDAEQYRGRYYWVFFLEVDEARKLLKFMRYAVHKYGIIYGELYNPMKHFVGARQQFTNRLAINSIARRKIFEKCQNVAYKTLENMLKNNEVIIAVKPEYGNRKELDVYMERKKFWLKRYPDQIRVVKVEFDLPIWAEKANVAIDIIVATV